MEPLLDETSLEPCAQQRPHARISALAQALQKLDQLGFPRMLRTVRDAADRPLADEQGLRYWCFNSATPRDARLLLAGRLASQPYIDGPSGLFAVAEGNEAVEARVAERLVYGLGYAALADGVVVVLSSATRPAAEQIQVELTHVDDAGVRTVAREVATFVTAAEIAHSANELQEALHRSVPNGAALIDRIGELFPRLRLGTQARTPIAGLTGNEPYFGLLLRHLRALDAGAEGWSAGDAYEPKGVTWSVESQATLEHGTYGPMRNFAMPPGFEAQRWSSHTKLSGGAAARLYFQPTRVKIDATSEAPARDEGVVLVGYFGPHLPTVRFHT